MPTINLADGTHQHAETDLPPGFDPVRYPVIAKHYFGVEPLARGIARLRVVDDLEEMAA